MDDDDVSIMAPHQSYFDEYPSGTGKIIFFFESMNLFIIYKLSKN